MPRAGVVLGEALVAVTAGWLAWWCWQRGLVGTVQDGVELTRVDGRWWASAVAAATLAGILVLVTLRRLIVPSRRCRGRRCRSRRYSAGADAAPTSDTSTMGAPQAQV